MARNMAVKNKQKRNSRRIDWSIGTVSKKSIKIGSVFFVICFVFILISQVSKINGSVLPIEKIEFHGATKHIDKSLMIKQLKEITDSGMLSIDLPAVRLKIKQNPWVEQVEIRKQWPETLIVNLIEEVPLAVMNDSFLLAGGEIVHKKAGSSAENLTKLEVTNLTGMQKQEVADISRELLSVSQVLDLNLFSVDKVIQDESNSWTVLTKNDLRIKIGRKNQMQRIERLLQVYVAIENKSRLRSIDLRYRNGFAVELHPKLNQSEIGS